MLVDRPNDAWRTIFINSIVCTILFFVATTVTDLIMNYVLEPLRIPFTSIVYLPIWSASMLIVLYYARWRGRLRFNLADIYWTVPTLLTMAVSIELCGTRSVVSPIATYIMYIAMKGLRFRLNDRLFMTPHDFNRMN